MSPIQIRRPDVVEHIRELADLTGLSITDAIDKAVETQLEMERASHQQLVAERTARAKATLERLWSLPVVGPRLTDDDLYDEEGMPK